MPQSQEVANWRGRRVVDQSGEEIGTLDDIYLDSETDQPEWAVVGTSLLAGRSPFVPLTGASSEGDTIRVPFAKDQVKDAPSIKADEQLSQDQEAELYSHYGLEYSFVPSGSGLPEDGGGETDGRGQEDDGTAATGSRAESNGPAADRDPESEARGGAGDAGESSGMGDEVRVRAQKQPRERVRLKKYLVTEHVTKTVPIQREEVRVERESIDGDDDAAPSVEDGGDQEITLSEEEAIVERKEGSWRSPGTK